MIEQSTCNMKRHHKAHSHSFTNSLTKETIMAISSRAWRKRTAPPHRHHMMQTLKNRETRAEIHKLLLHAFTFHCSNVFTADTIFSFLLCFTCFEWKHALHSIFPLLLTTHHPLLYHSRSWSFSFSYTTTQKQLQSLIWFLSQRYWSRWGGIWT